MIHINPPGFVTAARGALIVALSIALYGRVWWAGFIGDDYGNVVDNECLRAASGLVSIWFRPGATVPFCPLTYTSLWIDYQLWGVWPAPYHAVNILLHAIGGVLLWLLLKRLSVPAAWLGALLFAVHPINVETVGLITGRSNALSCMFGLLALLAWSRFRFEGGGIRWFGSTIALFLAAVLCNVGMIALPAVLLILTWWKTGHLARRDIETAALFFAVASPLWMVAASVEKQAYGTAGNSGELPMSTWCVMAGRAVVFYASKLIWPEPLLFFYPRWEVSATDVTQWAAAVGLAVGLASLWAFRSRLGRAPAACLAIFLVLLFPGLESFEYDPFKHPFVRDHDQYHAAAAGLAGLGSLAWAAGGLFSDPRGRSLLIGAWLGTLAAITVSYSGAFLTGERLYRHVLWHNPRSSVAALGLGVELFSQHRLAEVEPPLRVAVIHAETPQQRALALANLGLLFLAEGKPQIALNCGRESVEVVPADIGKAVFALALARLDRADDAERILGDSATGGDVAMASRQEAVSLLLLARGDTAFRQGNLKLAAESFEGVADRSRSVWVVMESGRGLGRMGLHEQAERTFRRLLYDPGWAGEVNANLATLAAILGDMPYAASALLAAVRHDPDLMNPDRALIVPPTSGSLFDDTQLALLRLASIARDRADFDSGMAEIRSKIIGRKGSE